MGYIVYLNINSYLKISFMEQCIKYFDNVLEWILYEKGFEIFYWIFLYQILSFFCKRMILKLILYVYILGR